MTPTPIAPLRAALLAAFASLYSSGAEASDFASTRPAARVEYWQTRQAAIDAQVADTASLRAVKLVFVGSRSASRRILTICSSLNLLFLITSSLSLGSHRLTLHLVRKTLGRSAGAPMFAFIPSI
jgi:hypothetical protein